MLLGVIAVELEGFSAVELEASADATRNARSFLGRIVSVKAVRTADSSLDVSGFVSAFGSGSSEGGANKPIKAETHGARPDPPAHGARECQQRLAPALQQGIPQ